QAVAPRDPVVRVAAPRRADVPAAPLERAYELDVVAQVLLRGPARDRRRDRRREPRPSVHLADEAHDPPEARKPAFLVAVEPRPEEAARLEEEPADHAWLAELRVQSGERAQARSEHDRRPV